MHGRQRDRIGALVDGAANQRALLVDVVGLFRHVMHGDRTELRGDAVGAEARRRAVRDFAAWAAAYHPVSEQMHGYGDQEITYTAADPTPGWRSQLDALDLLAQRTHRNGFASLSIDQRRALVRPLMPRGRGVRLPSDIVGAPHVAVALLAHWANSSAATDLAYGVVIGKDQCRVLADAPRRPLPLAEPRGR